MKVVSSTTSQSSGILAEISALALLLSARGEGEAGALADRPRIEKKTTETVMALICRIDLLLQIARLQHHA
jgi:hypothetical protein